MLDVTSQMCGNKGRIKKNFRLEVIIVGDRTRRKQQRI